MKEALLLSCLIAFWGCINSSPKEENAEKMEQVNNIDSLIEQIPITKLPLGWSKLCEVDSIKFSYDYEHPKIADVGCTFSLDIKNKYGLNHIFCFDSLQIFQDYISLAKAQSMCFSKRLPDIDSQKVLIYYVKMMLNDSTELPRWLLLKVNKAGKPQKGYLIGEIDWGENDVLSQDLYYISSKYVVYARSYMPFKFNEDEEDEEENESEGYPGYLYSGSKYMVLDLKKDIVKYQSKVK